MKKNLLLFVLLSFYSVSQAQQLKWNIQAGTGLTNVTGYEGYKGRFGYRVGIGAELPFDKIWSVNASLLFLNKRISYDEELVGIVATEDGEYMMGCRAISKMNGIYLQLPIKAAARLAINKNSALKFSAGPYFAYGVGGKTSAETEIVLSAKAQLGDGLYPIPDGKLERHSLARKKVKAFSKEDGLKRFDFGLALGVDFEYKRWFVGVGGEYGLTPISEEVYASPIQAVLGTNMKKVSPRYKAFEMHIGMFF